MSSPSPQPPAEAGTRAPREGVYDAVVVGGALAGAATALLLRRRLPAARVLVVERQPEFPRKVGEATVEVSAHFLAHTLGLAEELERDHLRKHGLRFWFSDGCVRPLEQMTEVGADDIARVPSYQLERRRLDETVLAAAAEAGCEVERPARVTGWREDWPLSQVEIEGGEGGRRQVHTRWLIDASGRHAFVARRRRLLERTEEHPVAALWSRWRGAADLDDPAFLADGAGGRRLPPVGDARRRLATNHFCGYGWWCWVIPLSDGTSSVGLVHHKELFEPPGSGGPEERYRDFVATRPGLREILDGATPVEGDFHAYRHLPYRSRTYAGRGWALVGDAASFLDPYYSPGLDHVAMSVCATVDLVAEHLASDVADDSADGELDARLGVHNRRFLRSYDRWLSGLYLHKYELFGDAELTACSYLLDTSLYYLGVVTPAYRQPAALANPTFGLENRQSEVAWRLMRFLKRRLVRLARFRRHLGSYGAANTGRRLLGSPPGLGAGAVPMLVSGLALWLRLEARALAHRLLHGRRDLSRPVEENGRPATATGA